MTILEKLRQWQYPRAYRIFSSSLHSEEIEPILESIGDMSSEGNDLNEPKTLSQTSVCELCTNLWRLDRKLRDPETGQVPEDLRLPGKYLQSMRDELRDAGYKIHDHTGERMPEKGISGLKEIAFEQQTGIDHPIVLETVKPTVTHNDKVIQMGEVIVGLSKREEADKSK